MSDAVYGLTVVDRLVHLTNLLELLVMDFRKHDRRSLLLLRFRLKVLNRDDMFEARRWLEDAHVAWKEEVRTLAVLAERGLAGVLVPLGFLDGVHHVSVYLPIHVQMRELVCVVIALQQLLMVNRLPCQLVVCVIHSYRVRIACVKHCAHLVWVVNVSRLLERIDTYSTSS